MLSKSFNKKFSFEEQENLILNKFINAEKKDLLINDFNLNVFYKKRFFYKKLEEKDFVYLKKILDSLNIVVSFDATIFNCLTEFNLKEAKKYLFSDNTFFNPIEDNFISIELKKILMNKNSEQLMLDTSLFNVFYINKKTANHFSKLYLIENYNLYLLKRKKFFYLFGLNL